MLNNQTKNLLGILITALVLACAGCGDQTKTTGTLFTTAVSQVAPVLQSNSVAVSAIAEVGGREIALNEDSFSSNILDSIYQALRGYEFPRDEGVIDMHNIYKVLTHSDQIYETAKNSCTPITETAILSPFDLGLAAATYDCAGSEGEMTDAYAKGFAIRKSEGMSHVLLTYRGAPDPTNQEGHGILQGHYNDATGDLSLNMIHLTTYPSEEGFVVRTHLEGNAKTHSFSLRTISRGDFVDSSWTSLVGSGISRGAGSYFLFKANTSGGVSGGYFCISAEAGLAELQAMHEQNPEGKSTVDTECSDLQVAVDALDFIEESDVPTELADFEDGSVLLTY